MFVRRRDADESDAPSKSALLTVIRDVVEIVAIVAAGLWAAYTFVYENQVKPALSKPEMQFESTMTRLGERKGLVAVRLHGSLSNIGKNEVWLYGIAQSVVGLTVRPRRYAVRPAPNAGANTFLSEPDWQTDRPTGVFTTAFLTRLADPAATSGFDLEPGQSFPIDRVFYIAARRFDQLRCRVSIRYGGSPTPIAFRLEQIDGVVKVVPKGDNDAYVINEESSVLSLW